MTDQQAPAEDAIVIDGEEYSADDLTFRETHELRQVIRDLSGDEHAQPSEASMADFLPALVYVVKRRANPAYTLDEALDLKITEVLQPKRPTSAAQPKAATRSK